MRGGRECELDASSSLGPYIGVSSSLKTDGGEEGDGDGDGVVGVGLGDLNIEDGRRA